MSALVKFLPYAGWPLMIVMFFLWLDGRENLSAEIERCNTEKVAHAADAANLARDAVTRAYEERLATEARLRAAAESAVANAVAGRNEAIARANEAQRIIDELMRGIEDEHDAPIGQVCLVSDVPTVILDGMR